jgi:hypothetical protein
MALRPGDRLSLDLYTKSAREASAFIKSAVYEGISANKTVKALSDSGIGARRKDVLAIHRIMKTAKDDLRTVLPTNPNQQVPTWMLPPSMMHQRRGFNAVVETTVLNTMTGNYDVMPITVATDFPISEAEAILRANEIAGIYPEISKVIGEMAFLAEYNIDPAPRLRPI